MIEPAAAFLSRRAPTLHCRANIVPHRSIETVGYKTGQVGGTPLVLLKNSIKKTAAEAVR